MPDDMNSLLDDPKTPLSEVGHPNIPPVGHAQNPPLTVGSVQNPPLTAGSLQNPPLTTGLHAIEVGLEKEFDYDQVVLVNAVPGLPKKVTIDPALIQFHQNRAVMMIKNEDEIPKKLKKGCKIREIELLEIQDPSIGLVEIQEMEKEENRGWTPDRLRQDFKLEETNLSSDQQDQLIKLLARFPTVLSTGDSDVGAPVGTVLEESESPIINEIPKGFTEIKMPGGGDSLFQVIAPTKLSLRKLFLLAAAAWTCREGPELRTLDQALQGRRTARRNLALLVLRLHVLSYSQVPPRILSREFVVSSVKACVDRRVLSSQLLPLAYARSGSNLSTKPKSYAAFLLAAAARTCKRGPRTPNSRPSSARQADSGRTWLSVLRLHVSPTRESLRGSQPRVRCVERKGVCGQKGALVVSFCPSPTLAPEATSLRNLPSGSLSAGGCCTDVQRGPRTPNSRPSSAGQADSGTQLGSSSTASPPHKASNSSKDPSETWRYSPNFDFLRASPKTEGLVPRFLGRQFVVSSVKACVDRRVLSSQLLPLAYARSGSNLSTKKSFLAACLLAAADGRAREGPNSELSTKLCKAGGRDATLAVLLLRLHVLSSSRVPRK
ncbi:hypothetical protein Avbf_03043 [Armadillidium vulgare]|nr:hypothetical protein Avbf_03043 [Armadillidium vulgare]